MSLHEYCSFFEKTHQNVKKEENSFIRIMTSNILHSRAGEPAKKNWEERVDIMSAVYLTFLPDFLGLQEVGYQQYEPFLRRLSEVYATPNTPLGEHPNYTYHEAEYIQNHVPIFYNKHKYRVLDSRYHLFEEQSLWGYQWALYQSRENPEQKLIHMNLHFFSGLPDQRKRGVLDTHRELVHLRRHYPSVPIVVTGDYNLTEHDESFALLLDGLSMKTAMHLTERNDNHIGWCHEVGSMDLVMGKGTYDHISITPDLLEVKLHRVLYDEQMVGGSDHNPMFIDVKLR